nr:bidirectional sugar transporter SWEET4b [Hemerocallis fulva]
MVNTETIRTVVGIIGNVISLGLFLSPAPTFVGIIKKKDVEQFSPVPYLATLLNCMLWVLYGLPIVHPDSTLVITINGAGVVIELIYIAIFVIFSDGKKRLNVFLIFIGEVIFTFTFGVLVIELLHTTTRRSTLVGILCVIFCIMMYVAPLSVMRMVIKTKSVEYMPLFISVASFCNGACWTVYSLLKFDLNILIPNGIGLVFSVVQLILYAVFYKSTQRLLEARKKAEVGMTGMGQADKLSDAV